MVARAVACQRWQRRRQCWLLLRRRLSRATLGVGINGRGEEAEEVRPAVVDKAREGAAAAVVARKGRRRRWRRRQRGRNLRWRRPSKSLDRAVKTAPKLRTGDRLSPKRPGLRALDHEHIAFWEEWCKTCHMRRPVGRVVQSGPKHLACHALGLILANIADRRDHSET